MGQLLILCFELSFIVFSQSDSFPGNWQDFLSTDTLEELESKPFIGFLENYFQGDIRGVEKNLADYGLTGSLNSVRSDRSKLWTGKLKVIFVFVKRCTSARGRQLEGPI